MNEEKNKIAKLRRLNVIAALKSAPQPMTTQYIHALLESPYWDLAERKRRSCHTPNKLPKVRESATHRSIQKDLAFLGQQRWVTKEEILHRVPGEDRPVRLHLYRLRSTDGKKL
jgi:hypothetical protein